MLNFYEATRHYDVLRNYIRQSAFFVRNGKLRAVNMMALWLEVCQGLYCCICQSNQINEKEPAVKKQSKFQLKNGAFL
eukprot:snap_masked-scaffold_1-processed-gene-7.18-mRNA-1 protein AED:1.00 eAED:1.00 QI:0/0/0/0/1/1/2/0/77